MKIMLLKESWKEAVMHTVNGQQNNKFYLISLRCVQVCVVVVWQRSVVCIWL